MPGYYVGAPGISSTVSASNRLVFLQRGEGFLAQGRWINGSLSRDPGNTGSLGVLRPGTLMGMITTTGFFAPSVIGTFSNAYTSGATSFTISAAQAVELARRVGSSGTGFVIGPPTANGTVAKTALTYSAINTTTGVVTCTDLGADKVAGSWVTADDGSENILTFIPDYDWGTQVVDENGASVAQVDFPKVPISGVIDSSQLLPWPTDTSLMARIVSQLNGSGNGQYVFDHVMSA